MKNIILMLTLFMSICVQTSCAQNKGGKGPDMSQQMADRIVASNIPVVVEFWASWCMPCRILDPIMAEIEKEYKGKALFMKVDVDVHLGMTAYFQVSAVPSVFVIEDKAVRTALPGVRDKSAYKTAIDDALKLAATRKSQPKSQPSKSPSADTL